MIIPWIAIRDLSLHPNFQNLSDEVNVLDLGSGTGAIVLGLLHLFKSEALSRVVINIAALDCQTKALARQKDLLMAAGFDLGHVHLLEADLNNVDDCVRKADKYSPFSFIFAGNCLTELGYQKSIDLISRLSLELVGDGAIIIAEAQRDYVKKMVAILARGVEDFGLHVYYPCPGAARCTHSYCWVWRDHDYDFPGLQICGKPLSEYPKDKLTLSWLVLTRQDISIYDSFKREKPGLFWGPIARQKYWDGEKRIDSLGFCDGEQITICDKDYRVSSRYRRGSIVGISKDHKIERYHEL
jgi:16S rRNA G966 N2-methylase RsmD